MRRRIDNEQLLVPFVNTIWVRVDRYTKLLLAFQICLLCVLRLVVGQAFFQDEREYSSNNKVLKCLNRK